ncbi:hypothetical protein O181_085883 [Austropuccinia psidii MF-1]|uniref:Retrotransposon gag domain-containing protein n=1 Tax=Austropuccinia psidii MF-1 TaxID=1389203 RepID=A0A9Q3FTZ8_9BASI|nr:hypothetical protein [Austropuccinia psidii MF-1]
MPVQHSPPSKNTRSQRNQAVLNPTARVPLDRTPSVHQLSANLDRGPPMEGAAPSRRGGMKSRRSRSFSGLLGGYPGMAEGARPRLGEVEYEEGEESVEEKILGRLKWHMLWKMLQRKKVLYSTSFLTGRAGKWIEPYLSNISNENPSYLLNNWQLFETQLLTLFGDPNEVRKAQQELDNLRMKESGHVSLYIAYFRSLMSRIGDWGEGAYIHVYRRGLASRLLDQLASHPGTFDTVQELMHLTLELDTRYHERQKEKHGNQEKKPPATGSNQSRPPQDSTSKRPHQKKNKKGKQFQSSKDNPHSALLNKDNKLIGSEKERRIKEGLGTYCGGNGPIVKFFKRPQNKPGSSRGFPCKQGKA